MARPQKRARPQGPEHTSHYAENLYILASRVLHPHLSCIKSSELLNRSTIAERFRGL